MGFGHMSIAYCLGQWVEEGRAVARWRKWDVSFKPTHSTARQLMAENSTSQQLFSTQGKIIHILNYWIGHSPHPYPLGLPAGTRLETNIGSTLILKKDNNNWKGIYFWKIMHLILSANWIDCSVLATENRTSYFTTLESKEPGPHDVAGFTQ